MINLKQALNAVYNDLINNPDAIMIVDDQHIIDKVSGIEFHLYDDYFQLTRGNGKPVTPSHLSKNKDGKDGEQAVVMKIKEAIQDPIVTQEKIENYDKYITEARERLSSWFENPIPVMDGVQEETDADDYTR